MVGHVDHIEHWSLLFANVDKASREKMKQGDFVRVDFETALSRLKNISGVCLMLTSTAKCMILFLTFQGGKRFESN